MDPKSLECPNCGRVDGVKKVSAIVREGVVTGSSTGSGGVYTIASPLVYQLRVPDANDVPRKGISTPILFVGGGCLTYFGIGTIVILILAPKPDNYFSLVLQSLQRLDGVLGLLVFLLQALLVVPGILAIRAGIRAARNKRSFSKTEVPRAQAVWDDLYFCSRCDGGFVPAKAEFVPIAKLREYLYKK